MIEIIRPQKKKKKPTEKHFICVLKCLKDFFSNIWSYDSSEIYYFVTLKSPYQEIEKNNKIYAVEWKYIFKMTIVSLLSELKLL